MIDPAVDDQPGDRVCKLQDTGDMCWHALQTLVIDQKRHHPSAAGDKYEGA